MSVEKQKVFLIGLDGATLDLIDPWVSEGHLPTLKRLMDEGVSGHLQSTYPPITGPAWSTMMTGMNPDNHGVLEFFRRESGTYRQVLNTFKDIEARSLWRILSDAGKEVGVIGVPLTYPPEPVNGFLISGLLTPPDAKDFTYPPTLLEELETQLGQYRLRHDEKYRINNPEPFLKEQYEILDFNTKTAKYLLTHKSWDLFVLHILGTDRIQHEFWHNLAPDHPQHNPNERKRLGNVILDFYKQVDASLGHLIDQLDSDTAIIIISDHGFGPVHKFINVNTWLLEQGYIVLKNSFQTRLRHLLYKLGFNYSRVGRLILTLGLGKGAKRLGRARREDLQHVAFLSFRDVDWTRTSLYSMGNYGQIFINRRGREPEGSISVGEESEQLIEEVARRLKRLLDPQSGEAVFSEIQSGDQLYKGKSRETSPDLILIPSSSTYKPMGLSDFSSPSVIEEVYGTTGHHRMNGIFIGHRPGVFEHQKRVQFAHLQDITPTILYLLSVPVPESMDGEVLTDAFEASYRAKHPLKIDSESHEIIKDGEKVLSEEDEEVLSDWLRSLGYVN